LANPKKSVSRLLTLALLAIILVFTLINMKIGLSAAIGGKLDIFTQKEPYSGTGQDLPSDAFGPGETVQIYALLTYNDFPVSNWPVAFEIHGPPNAVQNITLYRTASTNANGLANVTFVTPISSETAFGLWSVFSNAQIDGSVVQDSLTFKVGWIVEIVSMRTLNESHIEQEKFAVGHDLIVELYLKNIAMTQKNVTLTVTIDDNLNQYVNSLEVNSFAVPPNETLACADFTLRIPENASPGPATVYANAYTAPVMLGGVSYAPEASKQILITKHDVAVSNVEASPTTVYRGEIVSINVTVVNKGSEPESFTVTIYGNATIIGQVAVSDLKPFSNQVVNLAWNTSLVGEGFYRISASAPLPTDIDTSDNTFIDSFVQVKTKPAPSMVHDVAVLDVTPSSNSVYVGETLDIDVEVENQGNYTESFNVTVFYDSNPIQTLSVDNLEPSSKKTLIIHWNTKNVHEGTYRLRALASPVTGEVNLQNNSFTDGVIKVVAAIPLSNWLLLFLLLLLILLIILFFAWLSQKKKKKQTKKNQVQPNCLAWQ
jgi:hypothetical protein